MSQLARFKTEDAVTTVRLHTWELERCPIAAHCKCYLNRPIHRRCPHSHGAAPAHSPELPVAQFHRRQLPPQATLDLCP